MQKISESPLKILPKMKVNRKSAEQESMYQVSCYSGDDLFDLTDMILAASK